MDVVVRVYKLTESLPQSQKYSLSDQMQRAAVSVPSNIAEGQTRQSTNSYRYHYHLQISRSSLAELETQVEITVRLGFVEHARVKDLLVEIDEISRMTVSLINSLKKGPAET